MFKKTIPRLEIWSLTIGNVRDFLLLHPANAGLRPSCLLLLNYYIQTECSNFLPIINEQCAFCAALKSEVVSLMYSFLAGK